MDTRPRFLKVTAHVASCHNGLLQQCPGFLELRLAAAQLRGRDCASGGSRSFGSTTASLAACGRSRHPQQACQRSLCGGSVTRIHSEHLSACVQRPSQELLRTPTLARVQQSSAELAAYPRCHRVSPTKRALAVLQQGAELRDAAGGTAGETRDADSQLQGFNATCMSCPKMPQGEWQGTGRCTTRLHNSTW